MLTGQVRIVEAAKQISNGRCIIREKAPYWGYISNPRDKLGIIKKVEKLCEK